MTDLAELTTMRVGGPAREVVRPASAGELADAVGAAIADREEWLVLGGGSNVVAPDEGVDATVVLTAGLRGIEPIAADDGRVHLRVAAGERWDDVVAFAVLRGLAGVEALSGIPGSVGAAPVQNIGAYGQELSGVLHAVELLEPSSGRTQQVPVAELGLAYRTSALKRGREGVVVSVELALTPSREGVVGYQQLAGALGVEVGASAPVDRIREAVLELRRAKGMLDDGALPSCGSFFLNPVVDENWARGLPADAPRWPVAPEEADLAAPLEEGPRLRRYPDRRDVKLSGAWLIEHAGIARGFALPGSRAAVSPRHTLSIVNTGGALAREIVQLAEFVQLRVSQEFGINLRPEPTILGA
ncbi:MAG: UDP-N-acetylenolpyruvoylglucosamine reductase [Micrococcales bacterium 73-13]|nr:MAG: UDP-N-acetylenolpyruvoylglucosamine reductase [Micrococcales bacterium 73-13]